MSNQDKANKIVYKQFLDVIGNGVTRHILMNWVVQKYDHFPNHDSFMITMNYIYFMTKLRIAIAPEDKQKNIKNTLEALLLGVAVRN